MKIIRNLFGFILLISLWHGGCAPSPRIVLDTERVEVAELLGNIRQNQAWKQSLHARGSISIETPDFANSGRFTLHLQHPDSMLMNLHGPFGLNVGSVFLTQNIFLFYNGLDNRVIVGDPRTDALRAFLRFETDARSVMELFLGGTNSILNEKESPVEFVVDGDQYLLIYGTEAETRRYWIDPEHRVVSRMLRSGREGEPLFEERYERFVEIDGIIMARSIQVISHLERARLAISYGRMDINTDNLIFQFKIPENAELIEW